MSSTARRSKGIITRQHIPSKKDPNVHDMAEWVRMNLINTALIL